MKTLNVFFTVSVLIGLALISGCIEKADPELKAEIEKRGKRWLNVDFVNAIEEGDLELVDLYLRAGKDPDTRKFYRRHGHNESVLMLAASDGNREMMELLLKHGADLKLRQKKGPSRAIHYAAGNGHMEIVKWLEGMGETLEGDPTVLSMAAGNEHLDMVMYLLNKDISEINESKSWAFIIAANYGYYDIVKYLVGEDAVIDQVNNTNETALMLACNVEKKERWEDYVKIVQLLMDNGANPDIQSAVKKETALMRAIRNQNLYETNGQDIIHILIEHGADTDIKGEKGRTALHQITDHDSENDDLISTIKILIEAGSDLNIREEEWDWTPMMLAIQKGNSGMVKVLLEGGADPTIRDVDGQTALDLARRLGNEEMIRLLEDS